MIVGKLMSLRTDESGLTLIEVLMGVVILTVAIAPVVLLLSGTLRGAEVQAETTRGLYLAQAKMEELLALDYNDLTPGGSLSGWVTAPDSVYVAVQVTMNPGGTFDTNMKQITVTAGTVTLKTYKTRAFEP